MRIIEVITDHGHVDTLRSIAEHHDIIDVWTGHVDEDGRSSTRMLVNLEKQQTILDALQTVIKLTENSRIVLLPVEATLPRIEQEVDEEREKKKATRSREELYEKISAGSKLDSNFILMVVMSTIVAAIGLLEDNVAVVIGAMVIAPLLGPNMSLAFAASLGDTKLAWTSFKTSLTGLLLAFLISFLIGMNWPLNLDSQELMSRTDVGLDGLALALASGIAAVVSITSSHVSSLVGVMVAVAILPPVATVGMMTGAGHYQNALGALLLLLVNIVCINLAAKLAFLYRGVRPRTWFEKQKAKQSVVAYLAFWIGSLMIILFVLHVRTAYVAEL